MVKADLFLLVGFRFQVLELIEVGFILNAHWFSCFFGFLSFVLHIFSVYIYCSLLKKFLKFLHLFYAVELKNMIALVYRILQVKKRVERKLRQHQEIITCAQKEVVNGNLVADVSCGLFHYWFDEVHDCQILK